MIKVEFSNILQKYTNGSAKSLLAVSTPDKLFSSLSELYPELEGTMISKDQELMPFVSMFIDGTHYSKVPDRFENETVSIKFIMAVAGG